MKRCKYGIKASMSKIGIGSIEPPSSHTVAQHKEACFFALQEKKNLEMALINSLIWFALAE